MPDLDINKLREAAHRAYPGMWHRRGQDGSLERMPYEIGLRTYELPYDVVMYLELVKPERVLRLVAEIEELRKA